ncbi:MAG: arabinan endo-1,5-alpha-L-arabinosidase [Caldilineaceae bacterium]
MTGIIQRIHDPVMAKEDSTYYIFSTGSRIIVICSQDMINWAWCGRAFERNPRWIEDAVPDVMDLWAPDISYFNGKWHLYYAGSTFGSNVSVIGLATNVTLDPKRPDYAWVDEGEVIASHRDNNWNAIDGNLVLDQDGQPWLVFGSYWSGIKLRKIDATTGRPATDDDMLYPLAQRFANDGAVEAPFIIEHDGLYYLFVSFDACCRGVNSTYNVRVGRATTVTGPYRDRDGRPMLEGGGTLILAAYDRWRGPGHNGIYGEDGTDWMVYHAYDAKEVGIPKLRIESLGWDDAGWPFLASQQTK